MAELSAAINARVGEMDHYVNPDGLKHTRHKGDHLHLAFNQRVIEQPMGGAGIFDNSMTRLVANPKSMECLDAVGCTDKKFWSGYVLSKPAGGPPLYWHNDWQFWDDDVSCEPMPVMMFGMVYLVDTSPHNGCLRVVPESHRRSMPIWDVVKGNNHLSADREGFDHGVFSDEHGVDVPMKAGDLLLGDSRILHGTHPNDSDERRTCITIWYLSRFAELPEHIRVGFANEWAGESGAVADGIDPEGLLEPLIPRTEGADGRYFAARKWAERNGKQVQEHLQYPSPGAQDFLGSNLPDRFWVDRAVEARL